MEPLEKALPQAPRDCRLNQRLASLYAAADRFADAAACCETLQSVYHDAGHPEQARQYGEMASRYRDRAAGVLPRAQAAAASAAGEAVEVPPASSYTVEVEAPPAYSVEVEPPPAPAPVASAEIDLSEEWETHAAAPVAEINEPVAEVAAAGPTAEEVLEEIRFYISQGMWNEARSACARCQAIAPANAELEELQSQVAMASAPVIEVQADADFGIALPAQAEAPPAAEAPVAPSVALSPATDDVLDDFVSDLEESLGSDFAVADTMARVAAPAKAAPTAPAVEAAPMKFPEAVQQEASSVLSDMFAEFKEDAESGVGEVDDPETHYNLGVAFREMGLMDEAIGELQKVCQSIEKGVPFSQTMQAYTWLAQCLVDKGVPGASYKWYEKALTIATDEQQRLSLHYDLALPTRPPATVPPLCSTSWRFTARNIDYRDVAERIKALKS